MLLQLKELTTHTPSLWCKGPGGKQIKAKMVMARPSTHGHCLSTLSGRLPHPYPVTGARGTEISLAGFLFLPLGQPPFLF